MDTKKNEKSACDGMKRKDESLYLVSIVWSSWCPNDCFHIYSFFFSSGTISIGRNGKGDGEDNSVSEYAPKNSTKYPRTIFINFTNHKFQITSTEQEETKSNDGSSVTVVSNDMSDDASNSDDSTCSKDFQDIPDADEYVSSIMPAKECETSSDFQNSDEFQDVECDDSDDSFLSSLEQIVGNDSPIPMSSSNTESNGTVLIEEFFDGMNMNVDDKIIENKCTVSSDQCDDDGMVLGKENSLTSEVHLENLEIETCKVNETDVRGNSTKITFYCESVNKLMADCVGDECDELIQEIPTSVDHSI